jgi:ornithine cyclodeaminase/alanine dehydrogenase-like protein (mu-crystallin family)
MTLFLDEREVSSLITPGEAVHAVERCFEEKGRGNVSNGARTHTRLPGSVLAVMHSSLTYLGRAGLKCYQSTGGKTTFVVVLFGGTEREPLAVMGADQLGRLRTGAAAAVATKHMSGLKEFELAVIGSGKQALSQVVAMKEVADVRRVRVWSRDAAHASSFAHTVAGLGMEATQFDNIGSALKGAEVATSITSSRDAFIKGPDVIGLNHLNISGSNSPTRAELAPDAFPYFRTVAADDVADSRLESGDLILAERAGALKWESVRELGAIVSGSAKSVAPSLFKSNGIAAEDVAVASLVYDNALRSGEYSKRDFRFSS